MDQTEPEFYQCVLVWGHGRVTEPMTARIGGRLREPRVSFSYLLAARRLLAGEGAARLDVVAVPIAYLQRHAFEVALKDLIRCTYGLERDRVWLEELRRSPRGAQMLRVKEPSRHHDYSKILRELERSLAAVGHNGDSLIVNLRAIGDLLSNVEQNLHTRFRYGPFDSPTVLELGTVQHELESLFAREFWIRDSYHLAELETVFAYMAAESQNLSAEIFSIEDAHGMNSEVTNFDDWL